MGSPIWALAGLAAFDLALLASAIFLFRSYPPMGRGALFFTGTGLSGFVFQAFLSFEGVFLVLQLACIAGVFGLAWLQHLGYLSRGDAALEGGAGENASVPPWDSP